MGISRHRVESSSIASIGYEPDSETLEVQFRSGAIYQYRDVPPAAYEDFTTAESLGRYFNDKIRPYFSYTRQSDQEVSNSTP